MADLRLYQRAADSYERAGHLFDAARCYRLAEMYRVAAGLHEKLGLHREAVEDHLLSGEADTAGWLLAHVLGAPQEARAALEQASDTARRALVAARCDLAEAGSPELIIPALDRARAELADPVAVPYPAVDLESLAVTVAELAFRYDQVALVFAASVRGGRRDAARRWSDWAAHVLGTPLTITEG
jgi:hypothetical protein